MKGNSAASFSQIEPKLCLVV